MMNLMPVISTMQAVTQDQVVTQQEMLMLTLVRLVLLVTVNEEMEV